MDIKAVKRERDARLLALVAHADQKYGDLPYYVHLDEVAAILRGIGSDLVPEAYLHDVLEDTEVERDDLAAQFGEQTAAIVYACTGEGRNRRERNASIEAKLLQLPSAIPVKLADRLANMTRSVSNQEKGKMYADEYPRFRESLHPASAECPIWDDLDCVYEELTKGV